MLKLPTFESEKSRRVLVALICALVMAGAAYLGLSPDPALVEDVVEVAVEETLAPEPEPESKEAPAEPVEGPAEAAEAPESSP